MTLTRVGYDVCIIGGGPVGSATAIAFARRGARVLVLEKDPRASHRFAGEWIHPAGVDVLDALRAGRLEGASPRVGYGFVIFPGDGSPPIELPYPTGAALSALHESLVSALGPHPGSLGRVACNGAGNAALRRVRRRAALSSSARPLARESL